MTDAEIPQVELLPKKGFPWWLLLPLVTLLIVIGIVISALSSAGVGIEISFPAGHGIKPGDALKHRGIDVGEITSVQLNRDGRHVMVSIDLNKNAAFLAREESRFWIVRPRLTLSRISGADTIVGARYIAVAPGDGAVCRRFTGLAEEPPIIHRHPDGLEIICQTQTRAGLHPGAPVLYRQVVVGRVMSVALSSDASAIEARLYIDPEYTELIRSNTVLWNASGFSLSGGIFGGMEFNVDSIETLLSGGIALAVPDKPGKAAVNGQRFLMHTTVNEEWLEWSPSIDLFKHHQHIHASDIPNVIPVTTRWQEAGFWGNSDKERLGYVIYTSKGLLGVQSLLQPQAQGADIIINKHKQALDAAIWTGTHLALVPANAAHIPWPPAAMRIPAQVEDAYVALNSEQNIHLPVARLQDRDGIWQCQLQQRIPARWHGAPVLAQSDRHLIGFLDISQQQVAVIPLPEGLVTAFSD